MRTRTYVVAVLAAPGLLGACVSPVIPEQMPARLGASRAPAQRPVVPVAPAVEPPSAQEAEPAGMPGHPCELITYARVPCDEAVQACEYTYWHCPRSVKPLRA
jgi:hypothetical protein